MEVDPKAPEIEVSPEMIEAGLDAYYHNEGGSLEAIDTRGKATLFAAVYVAMFSERPIVP